MKARGENSGNRRGERTRLRFLRGLRNSSTAYRHETWLPSRIRDRFGVSLRALTTRNARSLVIFVHTVTPYTSALKKAFPSYQSSPSLGTIFTPPRKITRQTFSAALVILGLFNSRRDTTSSSERKEELSRAANAASYHFLFGDTTRREKRHFVRILSSLLGMVRAFLGQNDRSSRIFRLLFHHRARDTEY